MQSPETSHTPNVEEALDLALDRPTVLTYQYFKQFKPEILAFIETHNIPAEKVSALVDKMGHSHYWSDQNGLDIYIPSFDELSRAQKNERKISIQAGCALPERMLVKNAIERTLTQEDSDAKNMGLWISEWWGKYGQNKKI